MRAVEMRHQHPTRVHLYAGGPQHVEEARAPRREGSHVFVAHQERDAAMAQFQQMRGGHPGAGVVIDIDVGDAGRRAGGYGNVRDAHRSQPRQHVRVHLGGNREDAGGARKEAGSARKDTAALRIPAVSKDTGGQTRAPLAGKGASSRGR